MVIVLQIVITLLLIVIVHVRADEFNIAIRNISESLKKEMADVFHSL